MGTEDSERRAFRRAWQWATFVAIPGILILLALGSWQVQRLIWKTDLNAFRLERSSSEPVALPSVVEDVDGLLYRPIWLEGAFRHESEMFVGARTHHGRAGYQVITPFERVDGTVVLINRGWIPLERQDAASRAAGQIAGPVRVEGLLVAGNKPGWFTPDNRPDENFWFWVDLESLSARAGIPVQRFLVEAGSAPNPGGYPIGGQSRVELRNEHLQYAIVWYALAVALGVIYVLFQRRRRRDRMAQLRGGAGQDGAQ